MSGLLIDLALNDTHYNAVAQHHPKREQHGPRAETKLRRKRAKIKSIANHPSTPATNSFMGPLRPGRCR